MAVAGCINAYDCAGCYLTTLQQLQSDNIGVAINYTAPGEYGRRQLDYIKYTDKCGCTCCLTGENELRIVATQGVIKNFTLTNDDTNERVIVKWNDLFGSNRAYTMVRYKTGSYPTSITDGTLAVKETTQNQYSVSGYNVSGLTDGTTYYFTAFAVSQDGTIIVVQNKTITTEFGRLPGVNTLAYFKLEGNLDNSSQYTVSTTTAGSITFQQDGDLTYGVFNDSFFYTSALNGNVGDITLCAWVKPNYDNGRMEAMAVGLNQSALYHFWTGISGSNAGTPGVWTLSCSNASTDFFSGVKQNSAWHLLVATRSSGGEFNLYLDGELIRNATYTTGYITSNVFIVGGRYRGSLMDEAWKGGISRAIYENKIRTLADVREYFRKTKKYYYKNEWTPGANTVAYYPLTAQSTINDMKTSGTKYNLTNTGATFGTYNGVSCAYFPNSSSSNTDKGLYTTAFGLQTNMTVALWFYQISFPNTYNCHFQFGTTRNYVYGTRINSSGDICLGAWGTPETIASRKGTYQGARHYLCVIKNGNSSELYIDCNLILTSSSIASSIAQRFNLGAQPVDTSDLYGYLSRVITENKSWTIDEMVSDYNLSKGNYGLLG